MVEATSTIIWIAAIAIASSLLIITAGLGAVGLNALVAALISLTIAVLAVRENEKIISSDADAHALASLNARYMAVTWGWAAVAVAFVYMSAITWPEWWHFCVGFCAAALLCLCFSNLLTSEGASQVSGDKVLRLSRLLALVQLVACVLALIGMVIDGKVPFLDMPSLIEGKSRLGEPYWAAHNIFFFGALALAAISIVSLLSYNRALGRGSTVAAAK
jgi:uncharacterized membrane protein YesL